ncbi:MAG: ribonuclease HI family protein [Thermomicrobiales bacterium]|nr:ribonuclease HI family protein [Thermomicrobiales bacterium]
MANPAGTSAQNAPPFHQGTAAHPYVVIFDGGSLGNPGKGYGSYLLVSPTGRQVHRELDFSEDNPVMTNNQAEYRTLIEALLNLRELLADRSATAAVRIEGDSQLVLNQLKGTWKVKNEGLRLLHTEARAILPSFGSVEFRWHPRERSVKILGH